MHILARYNQLDERGVQRPSILLAESPGLKQLLDERRLLLLQLSDALALIAHLLGGSAGRGAVRVCRVTSPSPIFPHLT